MVLTLRRRIATILFSLCLICALCTLAVFAQDGGTPVELLDRGVAAYEQGDYAKARELLARVEADKLDSDAQRERLAKTKSLLQDVQPVPSNGAAEADLAAAQAAERRGDVNTASRIYRNLAADDQTPASIQDAALSGLARVQRVTVREVQWSDSGISGIVRQPRTDTPAATDVTSTPDPVEVVAQPVETINADQQRLNQGIAQYNAGQLDQALATLGGVNAANLTGAERVELDNTLSILRAQAAAAPVEVTPVDVQPVPVEVVEVAVVPRPTPQQPVEVTPVPVETTDTTPAQPVETTEPVEVADSTPAQPVETVDTTTAQPVETTPAQPVETTPAQSGNDLIAQTMKLQSQQRVARAQQAEANGNLAEARSLYTEAIQLDPNNSAAQVGLDRVNMALASPADTDSLLEGDVQRRAVLEQQAVARYQEAMRRADTMLRNDNFAQAQDSTTLALSILDTNREYLSDARYNTLRNGALDLAAEIERRQERLRLAQIQETTQQIERDERNRQAEAERDRTRKVSELLNDARDLSNAMKYDLALEKVNQLLFIEPDNTAARFLRELLLDKINARTYEDLRNTRRRYINIHQIENLEASIPYNEIVTYPADWPALTEQRLRGLAGTAAESEANRRSKERLQQPIPIDFQANQFERVINYLRGVTGVNFFVNWKALEGVGIARDLPITMTLNEVPAEKALNLILDEVSGELGGAASLDYTIDEGIVIISTKELLATRTVIRTFDIRDLIIQVPNFTDAPEFDLSAVSQSAADGGVDIFGGSTGTDTEILTTRELTDRIMDLIRTTVDPDGWRLAGGLTSSMSELNGTLIVNSTPNNHIQIVQLLSQLREQRAMQIHLESRFLFVTNNFLEDVGIDVDLQFNDTHSDIIGTPVIQQSSFNRATVTATGIPGSLGATINDDGSVEADQASLRFGALDAMGNFGSVGFLIDDLQVNVMLRATQQDRRSIVLNTPRLTFFNGQTAYVVVARQIAYVSDLEPITGGGGSVGFNPTVSVISDGAVLKVNGTISADRRYVTLNLEPSLATVEELRPFPIFAESGNTDGTIVVGPGGDDDDAEEDDGISGGFIEVPTISLTEVKSTISVPDRGTVMLGGQRLLSEVEVEAGVPVLSKLPILNRLFTNRSTVKDERTLLILAKPTIIIQSEVEEEQFPGLNASPGAFNLGR